MVKAVATGRLWDSVALVVIVFIAYKMLIAPRFLQSDAPAPNISLASLEANHFTLREHRGRVVFLDFWASWCAPCKASLPMVEHFARSHRNVDVEAIDVGERRPIVAQFAREYGLQHVALDPDHLVADWFGIEGLPTIVVVDSNGRIRAKWAGFNPAVQINMAHAAAQLHS